MRAILGSQYDSELLSLAGISKHYRYKLLAADAMTAAQGLLSANPFADLFVTGITSLSRLNRILTAVKKLGIGPERIAAWTKVIVKTTPAELRPQIAIDVRNAVRGVFGPETWRTAVKPASDRLRQQRRDALSAAIMHRGGFERIEQLFEYFLIDPGMEPVAETSRIRLAISSVQLFIQRCLLNLEELVQPSTINSQDWAWMKRYRVWQANREIFLYPENWLEPEFRDDKTHLFTELESTLLQGDVTTDLVEEALSTYLDRLSEISRLDIITVHLQEFEGPDPPPSILHVIGRTKSDPKHYFYRRLETGEWTPWEPITTQITGDHVVLHTVNGRLYVFWVAFLERPASPSNAPQFLRRTTGGPQPEKNPNSDGGGEPDPKDPNDDKTSTAPSGDHSSSTSADSSSTCKCDTVDFKNTLAGMTPDQIERGQIAQAGNAHVQTSLSWSEYRHGKWAPARTTSFDDGIQTNISGSARISAFESGADDVLIHLFDQRYRFRGNSTAVLVEQDSEGERDASFYFAAPGKWYADAVHNAFDPTRFSFQSQILDSATPQAGRVRVLDFKQKTNFRLTVPVRNIQHSAPLDPAFLLIGDDVLYLEPQLEELTIKLWDTWIIDDPRPRHEDMLKVLPSTSQLIRQSPLLHLNLTKIVASPWSRHGIRTPPDWLTTSKIAIQFDEVLVSGRSIASIPIASQRPGMSTDFVASRPGSFLPPGGLHALNSNPRAAVLRGL